MHARIGIFEMPPPRVDEVVSLLRERAVAAFSTHDGFRGYQAYVDRERGRIVGISRWTTRAALEASGETARGVLAQAAALGAVIVGERYLMELAFDARPEG